jgi:hypothetical protein
MKRTIEIAASFTGKISTGQFENESPYFSAKEIIESEEVITDDVIKARQQDLQSICYGQFKRHAEQAYSEKIAKQYKNIRFYDGKDGLKYPSVTSIINMDSEFFMPPDGVGVYSAQG